MIAAVSFLCFVAGSLAIPVPTDYYPKSGCGQYGCSNGHGAHRINGGLIGINSNGFESSMLGFDGGNSAAAASASASGLGSAAAAAAAAGSRQQGLFGLNNGFNGEFGFNGGNSAAAASAAASGMNAAAAAAAAAAGSSGHGPFVGYQGATGQQFIGSYNGIIGPQGPYVQYQGVQQFGGFDGSAAAASAAAAASQQGAAAAAAAAGRNAAAASAAAAGRNAAAAAAAAASGANIGSQFGIGGLTGSQFTGQIGGPYVQPSDYFPGVPVFGQNSGAAAAASAAASNNAAAAAAAAAASGSNGFINGGIIGGSSGIIGSQVVPGRKVSFS